MIEQIPLVKVGQRIPPMSEEQRIDYNRRAKEKHMAQKKVSRKTQPSQNWATRSPESKAKQIAYQKEWKKLNPDKIKIMRRKAYLKGNAEYQKKYAVKNLVKQYGISEETYNAMFASQAGTCAICHGVNNGKRLFIDHNHNTGKVRGLLCLHCNSGIGYFKDNPSLIRASAEYLERAEG